MRCPKAVTVLDRSAHCACGLLEFALGGEEIPISSLSTTHAGRSHGRVRADASSATVRARSNCRSAISAVTKSSECPNGVVGVSAQNCAALARFVDCMSDLAHRKKYLASVVMPDGGEVVEAMSLSFGRESIALKNDGVE